MEKEFWGIFKANIDDRPNLTGVEKFSYLLPQLMGTAKAAVDGLLITDENYAEAVSILQNRFDRSDDRLLSMLLADFKKLSPASKGCIPTRKMFDT